MFMGFEEVDGDDDVREEFPCPFCSECCDIVGLCCHIDEEHSMEAKNGVLFDPTICIFSFSYFTSAWICMMILKRMQFFVTHLTNSCHEIHSTGTRVWCQRKYVTF